MNLGDQIKINIREDKIIHMQVKVYIAGLAHIKGPVLQRSVAGANPEFSKEGGGGTASFLGGCGGMLPQKILKI